jgi:hypothetical protein
MKHFFKYTTAICIAIILFLTQCEGKKEIIEVPIKIEVPVPAIEGKFEPIEAPEPIIVQVPTIDKQRKFVLMDSIGKLNAYIEAITVREYENTFEDDTIKIDTWSKVRGELLSQSNEYFIKPRTIQLDTVIEVQKPTFNALFFYGGIKYSLIDKSVAFEAKLMFKNKRDNLLSVGVDSDGYISAGYGFKL